MNKFRLSRTRSRKDYSKNSNMNLDKIDVVFTDTELKKYLELLSR